MTSDWALELNGVDDEDAALRQAIAMSLGEAVVVQPNGAGTSRHNDMTNAPAESPPTTTSSMSALGLDRKKMEEERLARQNKRKAESIITDDTTPARRPRLEGPDSHPALAAEKPPTNSVSGRHQPVSESLPYAKGTVLRTYALGTPRHRDVTIEQVFDKDKLELAVLSSFQWDEKWLMSKLNLRKTKVLMIAFAADEAQKTDMRDNVPSDVIRFVFPPMENGASIMHSKLQLLKYQTHLRIVVPTGNLVPYDWGETGTMENVPYRPRLAHKQPWEAMPN